MSVLSKYTKFQLYLRQVEDIEKDLDQSSGNAVLSATSPGSGSSEDEIEKIKGDMEKIQNVLKILNMGKMLTSKEFNESLLNEMQQVGTSHEDINKMWIIFNRSLEKTKEIVNYAIQTKMNRVSNILDDLKSDLEREKVDPQAIKFIFEKIKDIESKVEASLKK